jgi:Na+/melibiose symporter-like transporter
VLLAGGALATLLTVQLGVAAAAVSVAVVGTGYAACQMFPLAMLPDVAAADTARTGESRAGTYTGVWTAGETLGLALGPFLYAGVLTLGGYVSSTDASAAQPDSAHTAIALGFTVVPAVLVLASMLVLRSYRLDEEVPR